MQNDKLFDVNIEIIGETMKYLYLSIFSTTIPFTN
jgi:hypothetical protein